MSTSMGEMNFPPQRTALRPFLLLLNNWHGLDGRTGWAGSVLDWRPNFSNGPSGEACSSNAGTVLASLASGSGYSDTRARARSAPKNKNKRMGSGEILFPSLSP